MKRLPTQVRGGALLLVILLATVIAIGTTGLILLLQYHWQYAASNLRQERLQRNLLSATNLLLTGHERPTNDTLSLHLFDGQQDSIMLACQPWGAYYMATVWAYEQNDTLRHTFLMGKATHPDEQFTLYLADEHLPLSLSGHTFIRGDVFLPEAGIRKSYIENEAYAFEETLHDGKILHSSTSLPTPDTALVSYLSKSLKPAAYVADSVAIGAHTVLSSSVVRANHAITVAADANLNDILLFAPYIRFESGFHGRLQAFASDSLIVGSSCRFDYPSALGLIHPPTDSLFSEFSPLVRVDSASTLNGTIFTYAPSRDELLARITLAKETVIHGQVYADGLLELRGKIHGTTWCRRFTLQTPSSLYDNFILDGVMDVTIRSSHYAGSPLFNTARMRKVALTLNHTPAKNDTY